MPHSPLSNPLSNIMIVGSPGSGKSTLARQIGTLTGKRVIHMDHLYWKPGWVRRSKEETTELIKDAIREDGWIFEGNHSSSFGLRAPRSSLIIWTDLPRILCLWRALKRGIRGYGKGRPDLAEGCFDRIDGGLLHWIWSFPTRSAPKIEGLFEEMGQDPSRHLYRLRSRREVKDFLEKTLPSLLFLDK